MFRFTKKPSSGSHSQYLAKITSLVQCRYRRRTDVVSAMACAFCTVQAHTLALQWQPTLDILTGYISSRPMTSGCYYSF